MKKPNKLYRRLGGKRSFAGAAFAAVRHPKRSLRSAFGRDLIARDAAESFEGMEASKVGFQKVFAILKIWNSSYKGPRISGLFSMLNRRPRPIVTGNHRPELD